MDFKCDVTVKSGQEPQSRINTMLNTMYPKCSQVENLLIMWVQKENQFFFNLLSFFHKAKVHKTRALQREKKKREFVLVFSSLKVSFLLKL